jgi:sensor histidine kinase YesM
MKNLRFYMLFGTVLAVLQLKAEIFSSHELIKQMEVISTKNVAQAIQFGDSLLQLNIDSAGQVHTELGWLYLKRQNSEKALESFNYAKEIFTEEANKQQLAVAYVGIGKVYSDLDRVEEAIEFAYKASVLSKENNDEITESFSLILLSHIYFSLNNFEEAIAYNHQARAIQFALKDSSALASSMNDLSILYERNQQIDSALYFNLKALDLNKELDKPFNMAISYNNIARIHHTKKEYAKAIDFFEKSISIHNEINSNSLYPTKNLANVYYELKEFEQSKEIYLKALSIAQKYKDIKIEDEIYMQLLRISIEEMDFENTITYIKVRDSLKTLIFNAENIEKIKSINSRYQQILKEEQLKQDLEISKKNRIILIVALGLLALFGLFFYQRNRISKLKMEKENMILEQKVLRTQMNPHFIFNALTAIQGSMFDKDPLKSVTYLSTFSKLIRQNFEFTNKPLISLKEDLDALKNYIETQQLRFEHGFDYVFNVDDINLAETKIPPMLLQPFVENAIEHGLIDQAENALLQVNVTKEKDFYHFEIINNGKDFVATKAKDKREHAIDIFLKRLKIRGFGEEKFFEIKKLAKSQGTIVIIKLKL